MGLSVITPPDQDDILAILPVAELKANLRITNTAEDELMKYYIWAAYDWLANPVYGWLNRSLLTTTFRLTLPGFKTQETYSSTVTGGPATRWVPSSVIELPKPRLVAVSSLSYLVDGTPTVIDDADYTVWTDGETERSYIQMVDGSAWPTTIDTHPNAVSIDYSAGFGDEDVIREQYFGIVHAMKLLAGDAFRNREATYAEPRLVAVNRKVIFGVERYAGRYRIMNRHA